MFSGGFNNGVLFVMFYDGLWCLLSAPFQRRYSYKKSKTKKMSILNCFAELLVISLAFVIKLLTRISLASPWQAV